MTALATEFGLGSYDGWMADFKSPVEVSQMAAHLTQLALEDEALYALAAANWLYWLTAQRPIAGRDDNECREVTAKKAG